MLTEPIKVTLLDGAECEFRPRLGALLKLERKLGENAFEKHKFEATCVFLYECVSEKKWKTMEEFADLVPLEAVADVMTQLQTVKGDTERPFGPKLVS